jgi:hypothetical protein
LGLVSHATVAEAARTRGVSDETSAGSLDRGVARAVAWGAWERLERVFTDSPTLEAAYHLREALTDLCERDETQAGTTSRCGPGRSGCVAGFNHRVKVLKRRCYGSFDVGRLFQRLTRDRHGYPLFGHT